MAVYTRVVATSLVVAISSVGIENLKQAEGLRLKAYPDPYRGWEMPTICYGRTKGVRVGQEATKRQCDKWLEEDATKHCDLVYRALVPHNIWLTQGEQDAYCSFAYNLGRFAGTDSVYGRLIAGDDWGACKGLLKYYYSNGKPSEGLYNRRYKEYNMCISQLEVRP